MTGQQLKNSILQMAVQGKLVPQDPNDEPASVLLERIRAEKEALIKAGKIKKEKNPSVIFRGADNLPYEKVGKNEPVCIADEVPFEIPDSWEWVRLSTVVYNRGQITPTENFCYIDIGSIDNKNQKLSDSENIISSDKAPSRARKVVSVGDILYSTVRPYLHNMCIIDREFSHQPIASTGFAVLTCHGDFYNEFLFYYLMSPDFDSYANDTENAKGVAYPAINDNRLYKALIPVPPQKEQIRIVERIKSVIPFIEKYGIAQVEVNALNQSFPELLKKSILQEAVQGKLVQQDENDEPASVLLERIRAEKQALIKAGKIKKDKNESVIFRRDNSHYEKRGSEVVCIDDEIPFEIPNSWEWVRLKSICTKLVDGDHNPPKGETFETQYIMASSTNINNNRLVELNKVRYLSKEVFEQENLRTNATTGDLFFTSVGSLGRSCVYEGGYNVCFQRSVSVITTLIYNYYLKLVFDSAYFQNKVIKEATGTAQKGFYLNQLAETLIPVPPMSEQQRIVDFINKVLSTIEAL